MERSARRPTGGLESECAMELDRLVSSLRRSRIRSVFSSVADWQRRLRSFSSVFSRIGPSAGGIAGLASASGRGSRLRIASKTTACVSPSNGGAPVAIW